MTAGFETQKGAFSSWMLAVCTAHYGHDQSCDLNGTAYIWLIYGLTGSGELETKLVKAFDVKELYLSVESLYLH